MAELEEGRYRETCSLTLNGSERGWARPKPGSSSRAPPCVLGPKDLGHPLPRPQDSSEELHRKWNSLELKWCSRGLLAP